MKRAIGYLFATVLAAILPAAAVASGWTMPKGEGRVIVTGIFSESYKGFDDDGNVVDIANYDKTEIYALGEYGLTDDLTLVLTPSVRDVSVEGPGNDSTGLGYTEVGARYRLGGGEDWVVSAQGTVRIPGKKRRDVLAQIGQTDAEYDFRAQAGHSFGPNGQGFVIGEAGYRFRSGDPANEFHADLTLGYRVAPKFLVLANSFNTISDGSGRGIFDDQRYHNLYVSGVYDVSSAVSVQLGAMGTIAGDNALRERGLLAGLWFRF